MDRPVLRRVLSGESILQAEKDKNGAWRQIIIMTVWDAEGDADNRTLSGLTAQLWTARSIGIGSRK